LDEGTPGRRRGHLSDPGKGARSGRPSDHPDVMRFGLGAVIDIPLRALGRRAEEVEELGFDRFWLPDERLTRNVYTGLTVCALHTDTLELGVAVTNPYSRNVALTAAAAATIDELSGGRFSLGFGAGGGLGHYGIERTSPAVAVREAIEVVRLLLAGKPVTFEGRQVRMKNARVDFEAIRQIPIYIAARGPRLLELAGEIADGAIIGGFASANGIAHAKAAIGRGLQRAGRTWADLDLVSWLYTCVADDAATARRAVSRLVTTSLVTSRPILESIGVIIPPALRACLESTGWSVAAESVDECANHLTDEILDAFSVAGTPDQCAKKLAAIAQLGVRELAMVALPAKGQTVEDIARRLAHEVIPQVRSTLAGAAVSS
jgi:5,10-methylenetetrahydromethanopterin reductase